MLLALTGLLLGAAFTVRLSKRKRRAQPLPKTAVPTQPAGRSDAERSLRRMAIGAGIVVTLAIAMIVVTRPSEATVPGPGPARRSESVLLTGTRGTLATRAVLSVTRIRDSRTGVVITIHVRNTGDDWIDTRFVEPWLTDSNELRFPVGQLLPSHDLSVSRLDPGQAVNRVVEVSWPHAELRRLHLEEPMGDDTAVAEWNLQ